jgi:hypothetical protein
MTLSFDYRNIFQCLREHDVDFLLVGGLNFFLIHQPVSTQDVDVLVETSSENLARVEVALATMDAQWGKGDDDWGPVSSKPAGWFGQQSVYCLLTKWGSLDIFLQVTGISSFGDAKSRSIEFNYDDRNKCRLISAQDLLACQLALPEHIRKVDRVRYLMNLLKVEGKNHE